MKRKMSKFRLWGPWAFKRMEAWLEEVESEGWELVQVRFFQMFFIFEQSQKANNRTTAYSIDFHPGIVENYLLICEDDGWNLLSSFFGWHIWRKESNHQIIKLYTDYDSITERNRRIYMFLIFILAMQSLPLRLFLRHSVPIVFMITYGVLLLILLYSIVRLMFTNYILKKGKNK